MEKLTQEKRHSIFMKRYKEAGALVYRMTKTINKNFNKEGLILGGGVSVIGEEREKSFFSLFYLGNGNKVKNIELSFTSTISIMDKDGRVEFVDANGIESAIQLDKTILYPNEAKIKELSKEIEELLDIEHMNIERQILELEEKQEAVQEKIIEKIIERKNIIEFLSVQF